MRLLFLTLFLNGALSPFFAQSDTKTLSQSELEGMSESVCQFFVQGEYSTAITLMQPYYPFGENEFDELRTQTVKQMNLIAPRFGETLSYHVIREEGIADFAKKFTYLLRMEKHAIRLKFTYFRGKEGWFINGFTWDDSYDEEFK